MNLANNYNKVVCPSEQFTITYWIDKTIEKYKEKVAIVDKDVRVTYSVFGEKIQYYAILFLEKGIRKRDNVVLQMPNIKEYIYSFFGLIKIGAVPVITNPALGENEVSGIIEKTNAVAYVYSSDYNKNFHSNLADNIKMRYKNIILLTDKNIHYHSKSKGKIQYKFYNAGIDEIAFLMMSAGTTGSPKIVPITHNMIFWHVSCYIKKFNITCMDSYLSVLPLTHKIGLYSPGFLNTLFAGGKTVLCERGSCDEFFSLIQNEKITITSIVPTLARIWIDFLKWDFSYDLSSLRAISIGGSVVKSDIIYELISKVDCDVQIMYGTTEGLSMYGIYNRNSKRICSGYKYLISGCEDIKIINSYGQAVKENELGELVVKSPYTIKSYYNSYDNLSNRFTSHGYYRTGDKVCWNREIGYQVLGRIVDQINRAGEKIDPNEIEQFVCEYVDVEEAAAVGIEDELLGERICMFVISKNKQLTLEEINNFLRKKEIAYYKIPDQLVIVEKWPLTPVNKIDKVKLKELGNIENL